jgi:threonine aldolase
MRIPMVLLRQYFPKGTDLSVSTGHVLGREAGALEATGHKVISMPSANGKLDVALIKQALDDHAAAPHMVKPKMVYISNATEIGTIYSKVELQEISQFCRDKELYFLLDRARLGSALTSKNNDVSLQDLSELTDVFWIGGTKAGALIGEAIVINSPTTLDDFDFHIKQREAMLAKGRILGIQFLELFKDELFFDLSRKANGFTEKISSALIEKGYQLSVETNTNQIFPILPNNKMTELEQKFAFYHWGNHDEEHTIIRLVTSWATDEDQVDAFIKAL